MSPHVTIRYRRTFPHSVERAFAWLTDYQDDDPARTDAVVVKRPVLSRSRDKVVLEGTLELLGRRGTGIAEVDLMPPNQWRARIVDGSGRGSVYEYRLDPVPDGSRLTVDYHVRARRLGSKLRVWLAKPLVLRELGRMWDGFAAAMDRELAAEATPPTR